LEVSGQVGAEKEYLHQIEGKVEKPFHYEWVEGWSTLLGSMVADLGVVMALFLGIVLSSLFAGDITLETASNANNSTVNAKPVRILARAIFPQPFRVVNTSVLVLSCHSPANKEDSVYSGVICITCCFKRYITVVFYGNCRMGYADSEY